MSAGGAGTRLADELVKELAALEARRERGFSDQVTELRHLAHELQVHQAELELQNQQLMEMQGLLEQSRARYVELYDHAPVGYLTLDAAGKIIDINLTAAQLFGRERARLVAANVRSLLSREDGRRIDAHLRDCFTHGQRQSIEVLLRSEGGNRFIELVSVPVRALAGQVVSCQVALTDVTERRRADAERDALLEREQEARELAERANRVKEDFLAVVSHELRAPMAPMRMWMKVLRDRPDDPTTRARALEVLDACIQAQVKLIDDLVDVVRASHGKLRVERQPLEIAPVVERVVAMAEGAAAAKQIALRAAIDAPELQVLGDAERLQQAIGNVLGNAVKFTPERGHVTVRLRRGGGRALIEVRDDGEGIDAALLPHVFEPFRQQDSTAVRRHGGLGLGLAIARDLLVLHEGSIAAESAGLGLGATFTIDLPLLFTAGLTGGQPAPLAAATNVLAGRRILAVDDDGNMREALQRALADFGAEVVTAASAQQAREALAATPFDVVVCDLAMPEEDGCTFITTLRAEETRGARPRVAALALTAHASVVHRRRALEAGFDTHLVKPVDIEQLVHAITALLPERAARLQT